MKRQLDGIDVDLTPEEEEKIIAEWAINAPKIELEKTPAFIKAQEILRAQKQFETDLKHFAKLVMKENNLLRDWATKFMAATAAATNITDLKTRVAALPPLPQRTIEQLKTALGED